MTVLGRKKTGVCGASAGAGVPVCSAVSSVTVCAVCSAVPFSGIR